MLMEQQNKLKLEKVSDRDALYHHIYIYFFIKASINKSKSKSGRIKYNGRRIHTIRFADDTVLLVESQNDTNKMLNILTDIFEKNQMKINRHRIKTMLISKLITMMKYISSLETILYSKLMSFSIWGVKLRIKTNQQLT